MSTRFSNSITLDRTTLQFCSTRSVDLRLFVPGITFWTDEDQRRAAIAVSVKLDVDRSVGAGGERQGRKVG